MTDASTANAAQRDYWNGDGATMWVQRQAQMDASLAPVAQAIIALAAPQPGERILDIGCGTGDTVLTLAGLVGPTGHVTGLDVSAPMLGLARSRAEGQANITLVLGDAAAHEFPPAAADLLFSRFGVMFFGDPTAAFTNMRKGLKPGGRLAFACWRPAADNPWVRIPARAIAPFVGAEKPPEPGLPGQFAFGDANHVTRILEAAGFTPPSFTVFNQPMPMGRSVDEAVERMSSFGSTGRMLGEVPAETRDQALAALRAAITPFADASGFVAIQGTMWLVTARVG